MTTAEARDKLSPRHVTLIGDREDLRAALPGIDPDDSRMHAYQYHTPGMYYQVSEIAKDSRLIEECLGVDVEEEFGGLTEREWNDRTRIFYRVDGKNEAVQDVRRMFLTRSIENGAVPYLSGFRHRIVAIISEISGSMKETKVMRTDDSGDIECIHGYNSMDALTQYATWVHALALEFGSGDEHSFGPISRECTDAGIDPGIVQAFLVREASDVLLANARHQLKMRLGGWKMRSGENANMSELARSLHADRPNLLKLVRESEKYMEKELDRMKEKYPDLF